MLKPEAPVSQNMTIFGDKSSKEAIKLKQNL